MKNISLILLLVLLSPFYSCSNVDDDKKTQNPSENSFTFNSELYTTDELFWTFTPERVYFFIIDDTSEFNTVTREFEGEPGQIIFIELTVNEESNELIDIAGTYTDVVEINSGNTTEVSFAAALVRDVPSLEALFNESNGSETILRANAGEIAVGYDSETSIFSLDYTFTTEQGVVTGFHESEFIILE